MQPHANCLEHLEESELESYLLALHPGSDVEHRGTRVSSEILDRILTAVTDPTDGRPTFGAARFDATIFPSGVDFRGSHFRGLAVFEGAYFYGPAIFAKAEFTRNADFRRVNFERKSSFSGGSFGRSARFEDVVFSGVAALNKVTFRGSARFDGAQFVKRSFLAESRFYGPSSFKNAVFSLDSDFSNIHFEREAYFEKVTFGGSAWFSKCQFVNISAFTGARFGGLLRMEHCVFSGTAQFDQVKIGGNAEFEGANFKASARFGGAKIFGQTQFKKVTFGAAATFRFSSFAGSANFSGAHFAQTTSFDNATFDSAAKFDQTTFATASHLGPIVCLGTLHLSGADFSKPITIELSAPRARFRRTRFNGGAIIKARYAAVDLTDATISSPVFLTAQPQPFTTTTSSGLREIDESRLSEQGVCETASVVSVRGVDVSHLTLNDVSLNDCEFSGAINLDKIRLQGDYRFPEASTRWTRLFRIPLLRPTRRVTLAEEQYWRAKRRGTSADGWKTGPNSGANSFSAKPRNLAATYRELRKSLEDSKNEPDAADFYYGEMEMRRHDDARPAAERHLLTLYWLVSGYGLRAVRSFTALLIALCIASTALMLFGLPSNGQSPRSIIKVNRGVIVMEAEKSTPSLSPKIQERASWSRFEQATQANLNAIFFRRSEVTLTTLGVYIQMIARLIVPTLFVLGVLAVRNRVKR